MLSPPWCTARDTPRATVCHSPLRLAKRQHGAICITQNRTRPRPYMAIALRGEPRVYSPAPRNHKQGVTGKTPDTRGKPAPPLTVSHPVPTISIPAPIRVPKSIAPPPLLARLGNEAYYHTVNTTTVIPVGYDVHDYYCTLDTLTEEACKMWGPGARRWASPRVFPRGMPEAGSDACAVAGWLDQGAEELRSLAAGYCVPRGERRG